MRWFYECRSLLYESMHQVFPLALIYSFSVLIQNLFLSPTSFFAVTAGLKLYKNKWIFSFTEHFLEFNRIVLCLLVGLCMAYFIRLLLKRHQIDSFIPSLISFLLVWLLFGEVNFDVDNHIAQPIWLFQVLGALVFYGAALLNRKLKHHHFQLLKWLFLSLFVYITLFWGITTYKIPFLNINDYVQEGFSNLLGNGPSHLFLIIFLSFGGVIFFSLGLIVPEVLASPNFSLNVVSENLDAVLNHSIHKVSHLFTLYTVQDAFALYGGVGLLLALGIAILLISRRYHINTSYKMAGLSFIPLVFDQPLPLLLTFPILFQPLLLIPMLLTTLVAELLGACCLAIGLINPAVYEVPTGTPNFLFGFLASNGDWRYLLVTIINLVISVMIYLPFVKIVLFREVLNEKNSEL